MKPENKLKKAKDTLLILLVSVPISIYLIGNFLPALPSSNMLNDSFWANKISNENKYDIIIVGDSRVYRGINPLIISQKLNTSVYNYGFSSAGLDSELLINAIKLLKQNGEKIMLIGITPASFSEESLKNEHFKSLKHIGKKDLWIQKNLYPYLSFFNLYNFSDLKKLSNGEKYFQTFNLNGFVYSSKIPQDSFHALQPYIEFLRKNRINNEAMRYFLYNIKCLKSKGITCFAFRIPISSPIKKLENSVFNFNDFEKKFIAAGGRWISLPKNGFNSYDGSHLEGLSANKLSGIIADSIANNTRN